MHLLGGETTSPTSLYSTTRPRNLERAEADFVAQRKAAQRLLRSIRLDVQDGPDATCAEEAPKNHRRSSSRTSSLGNYFIHNGLSLYLESGRGVGCRPSVIREKVPSEINSRTQGLFRKRHVALDLLYASLYKALIINGKSVTRPEDEVHDEFHKNFGGVTDEDTPTGQIYILKSLSDDVQIRNIENLYKIGYTSGSLDWRLHKAEESPTYLMAGVEVIQVFECYNMNPQKLEHLVHRFFGAARLMVDVMDAAGVSHKPREWFIAPLPVIEEAVRRIVDGSIVDFRFDGNRIVPASQT